MKYLFIAIFLLFNLGISIAQGDTEKPTTNIQKAAESMMNFQKLKHAAFSFYVKDLGSGQTVADYNGDMSLPTASTMKLVTTCTAFQILVADTDLPLRSCTLVRLILLEP